MSIIKFIISRNIKYSQIPRVESVHSSKTSAPNYQFKIELTKYNSIKINNLTYD